MKNEWNLTQEAFDKFLAWLNPNREQAAKKYEEVRRKLIKIFACRGCLEAEDLADETINRVIRKVQQIIDSYVGDPALYFYGVARNVHLEHVRKSPPALPIPPSDTPQQKEEQCECLERCLDKLSAENRRLVLEYYKDERRAKIDHRKELAERLGIAPNALRIRMHRVRASLQDCVATCMNKASAL
ncbi:MAG TPA: sigma-70 family RNA polymerase sigma factor [Blastocatellia bacterium]|jgi:RNA polymerase sigma factor (sigma-70 family)